ncbi:MAG: molybdate ABC transporter substrate-binding protein [Cyanobacteria bacterium P01_A01_bin.45]
MKFKNRRGFFTLLIWVSISFFAVIGCNQLSSTSSGNDSGSNSRRTSGNPNVELTVSVAASMQDAIKEVGKAYEQKNIKVKITNNFASSGTLTQQIKQGAPVDIFISANKNFMDELDKKSFLLPGTRENLLKNKIVLIIPSESNIANISFQDLRNSNIQRFSIGEPQSVPAGKYAKQVLTSLKIYDQIKPKIVFAKDVRQVLSYVELGNIDAGMVYVTDAKVSQQVKVVDTASENTHEPIVYPVAVIKSTQNPETAKEFIQFLKSNDAKDIFIKYGFPVIK